MAKGGFRSPPPPPPRREEPAVSKPIKATEAFAEPAEPFAPEANLPEVDLYTPHDLNPAPITVPADRHDYALETKISVLRQRDLSRAEAGHDADLNGFPRGIFRKAANIIDMVAPDKGTDLTIVGGGFAGTTTLLHTLIRVADDPRFSADKPMRIHLLEEKASQLYGGIAYGQAAKHDHRLNLSAHRVTPFADGQTPPEGMPTFVEYIQSLGAPKSMTNEQLASPSRQLYGNYLRHLVDLALDKAGDKVAYRVTDAKVIDVIDGNQRAVVGFKTPDGTISHEPTGHIVLATGFKKPHELPHFEQVNSKQARGEYPAGTYIGNIYAPEANDGFAAIAGSDTSKSRALVLGTGLSGMDAVQRLLDSGYKGEIVMMSRHAFQHPVYGRMEGNWDNPYALQGEIRDKAVDSVKRDAEVLSKRLKAAANFATAISEWEGFRETWQQERATDEEILTATEHVFTQLYARFPQETADYLAKNESFFNVARVGTTPLVSAQIAAAIKAGQVKIMAAEVTNIYPLKTDLDVRIKPHYDVSEARVERFNHFISAMGYNLTYTDSQLDAEQQRGNMLLDNMERRGLIAPHPTLSGISVTDKMSLIKEDGTYSRRISAVGVVTGGHVSVATDIKHAEKDAVGGRLGPFSFNIVGITSAVDHMLDTKYERIVDQAITSRTSGKVKNRELAIA